MFAMIYMGRDKVENVTNGSNHTFWTALFWLFIFNISIAHGAVSMSLSATPDPVAPGQKVNFTVTLTNSGTTDSGIYAAYATVPAHTTVALADAGPNPGCSGGTWPCQAGQKVSWGVFQGAGKSQTIQFAALVDTVNPPANGSLLTSTVTNNLTIGSGSAQIDVSVDAPGSSTTTVPLPLWFNLGLWIALSLVGLGLARRHLP